MEKTRVYQLAKYFDLSTKEIVEFIRNLGFDIKSHSSSLNDAQIEIIIHEYLLKYPDALEQKINIEEIEEEVDSPMLQSFLELIRNRVEYQNANQEKFQNTQMLEKLLEVRIESWNDFTEKVNDLEYRRWIFRGQKNSEWKLETSFYRTVSEISQLRSQNKNILKYIARNHYEMMMIEYFKSNAHLYLSILPEDDDNLEWLSIMQHYGAPTRMLDFSFSPYVALFFSLSNGTSDSAIYCFDKYGFTEFGSRESLEMSLFHNKIKDDAYVFTYEPKKTNSRLYSQQGLFLVPSNNYEPIDDILSNAGFYENLGFKYVIPKELHYEMIECLKKMNISSSMLFPGIEGYTLSLKNLMLENNETLIRLNNRPQSSKIPLS